MDKIKCSTIYAIYNAISNNYFNVVAIGGVGLKPYATEWQDFFMCFPVYN